MCFAMLYNLYRFSVNKDKENDLGLRQFYFTRALSLSKNLCCAS